MKWMGFVRFLTWEQIVQIYQIPPFLQSEVRRVLVALPGSQQGEVVFLESDVDSILINYFGSGHRPRRQEMQSVSREPVVTREASVADGEVVPLCRGHEVGGTDRRWLTPAEAAKQMRVNRQTVMRWCREATLEAFKTGNKWLIPQESVDAYLRKCRVRGGWGGDK